MALFGCSAAIWIKHANQSILQISSLARPACQLANRKISHVSVPEPIQKRYYSTDGESKEVRKPAAEMHAKDPSKMSKEELLIYVGVMRSELSLITQSLGIIRARSIIEEYNTKLLMICPTKSRKAMEKALSSQQKDKMDEVARELEMLGPASQNMSIEDESRIDASVLEKAMGYYVRWLFFLTTMQKDPIVKIINENSTSPHEVAREIAYLVAKCGTFTHFLPITITNEDVIRSLEYYNFSAKAISHFEAILKFHTHI